MDAFEWKDNSKQMFNKVCEATPWFARHFTRSGLMKGLKEHGSGVVTEQEMYDVCREITPAAHLTTTIAILDEYNTTGSATPVTNLN